MTEPEVMQAIGIEDEDEFDSFYADIITQVRNYGTHGVETMLSFIKQELDAGHEEL